MSAASDAPSVLEATIARRLDFPTWLPAMLVKELRQGVRQRGFVLALVGFQVVMTLVLIFAVAGGTGSQAFGNLQFGYWVILCVQLLVIVPLRGLTGLQHELDSRWVDLLMLTRLSPWRIVMGKWISLVVQSALLLVALLPYGVARYFFGSVNLGEEAFLLAVIFLSSCVLIALALWCSALPRMARLAVGAPLIMGLAALPGTMVLNVAMADRGLRTTVAAMPGWLQGAFLFDSILLLTLCLVGAVRLLSPSVESQTPVVRLLPVLGFVPAAFLSGTNIGGQLMLSACFFVFVAALELGRKEEPLAPHWLPWAQRGVLGRLVGRLVQPGWASALEWVVLVIAVLGVLAWLTADLSLAGPQGEALRLRLFTLPLFAAEALIFPVLLFSWLGRHFSHRLFGYLLVFVGMTILSLIATRTGASFFATQSVYDWIFMVLPVGSFWTTLASRLPPSPVALILQVAIALAVLLGAWRRARPYRLQRRVFEAAPREEMPP